VVIAKICKIHLANNLKINGNVNGTDGIGIQVSYCHCKLAIYMDSNLREEKDIDCRALQKKIRYFNTKMKTKRKKQIRKGSNK
jgi:hypothetical protein